MSEDDEMEGVPVVAMRAGATDGAGVDVLPKLLVTLEAGSTNGVGVNGLLELLATTECKVADVASVSELPALIVEDGIS